VVTALAYAITKHGQDPLFQTAVLSSEDGSSNELLKLLIAQKFFDKTDEWKVTFLETYSYITGARNQHEQINSLLNTFSRPEIQKDEKWQAAIFTGISRGIKKSTNPSSQFQEALTQLERDSTRTNTEKMKQLTVLYSESSQAN
jgi:hypothetical protein